MSQPKDNVHSTVNHSDGLCAGVVIADRYKLLEPLGEGGMGTVWVAEQSEPVRRRVAVKLIKAGMDSRQVLSRFQAERQALALMDHPNIAKVFDGGVTLEGRPYFVMELVRGLPITDYCNQEKLAIQERLRLFVQICKAVQHAHQKGIIHRDLKPSNILVAPQDGVAVPKVIDFGLAKAMHQPLTEQTLYTAHGFFVGTPVYMSPEQAEQSNLDIDTRSDVYSLGVVLYELLTDSTPLDKQQFKDAAINEMLRLIREVEPPKPSTRVSSSANLPSIAAQRQLEPVPLRRFLQGDLDWIVMKAIEKDRKRRYETANGFARDIERFLAQETVEARPTSLGYRVSKFVHRNRALIGGASLIAASLLAATAFSLNMARVASINQAAAEKAEQETKTALDKARVAQQETKVALDKATVAQQETKAALDKATLAEQRTRAALDKTTSLVIEKWLLTQPELTGEQRDFLTSVLAQYEGLNERSDSDEARLSNALARMNVGRIAQLLGDFASAEAAFGSAAADLERLVRSDHENMVKRREYLRALTSRLSLRHKYSTDDLGDVIREAAWREAEALHRDFPEDQTCLQQWIDAGHVAAYFDFEMRRPVQALALLNQVLPVQEKLYEDNARDRDVAFNLSVYLNTRQLILSFLGRRSEMEVDLDRSLEIVDSLVQEYPSIHQYKVDSGIRHLNRGLLRAGQGKFALADQDYTQAAAALQPLADTYPKYLENLGQVEINCARGKYALNQLQEGRKWADKATSTWEKVVQRYPGASGYRIGLAAAKAEQGWGLCLGNEAEVEQGLIKLNEAIRDDMELINAGNQNRHLRGDTSRLRRYRISALSRLNRFSELAAECEILAQGEAENSTGQATHYHQAGLAYLRANDLERAKARFASVITIRERLAVAQPEVEEPHRFLAFTYGDFGAAYLDAQLPQEAVPLLEKAVQGWRDVLEKWPNEETKRPLRTNLVRYANALAAEKRDQEADAIREEAARITVPEFDAKSK